MLKQRSWTVMGQSLAAQTTLYAITRDTLTNLGVGPEIIPWLSGPGRDAWAGAVQELGCRFIQERTVRVGDAPNSVFVNVALQTGFARPKPKWVEVCRKGKTVYIGNRRVNLKQSRQQLSEGTKIDGYTAMKDLDFEPVDPIFIQAFKLVPEIVPDSWKEDANGYTKHIFFWRRLGKDHQGEYADGFHWHGEDIQDSRLHLEYVWDYLHHSAMYER